MFNQTNETNQNNQPVFALRNNTERPETITIGTNELIGTDPSKLPPALARLMAGQGSPTALAYAAEVASATKAGQPWSHSYLRRNPPKLQRRRMEKGAIPPKWDGKAAERIVEHLERVGARK